MKQQQLSRRRVIGFLALAGILPGAVQAQAWPQKAVKVIVPFPPGGAVDIPARVLVEKLRQIWGQPVVVENRPGAGGSIGASEAARAPPDGYTLFFPAGSVMTAHQYIYPKLHHDPEKDFVPITVVASGPQVLVVPASSPFRSAADLVAAARSDPGKLAFGHAGIGSQSHLAAENFLHAAGINAISVPYKNGDPGALNDLISESLAFCVTNLHTTVGHVRSGKLKALGVTSRTPAAQLPGIPPIAEFIPGFENSGWFGLLAPTGTPREVIQRVYRDTRIALDDAQVRSRLVGLGLTPVANSPEEMANAMKEERRRWARIVHDRKIRVE